MADSYVTIQNFSGGENNADAAHDISDNECAKLTNLVPNGDSYPLSVRHGTRVEIKTPSGAGSRGIFKFTRSDVSGGSKRDWLMMADADGNVYYQNTTASGSPLVKLYTFPTKNLQVRFAVLLDKVFFTNGADDMYYWDGAVGSTPVKVIQKNSDGSTQKGPIMPFILSYRGRIWMAGQSSTVFFCGVDDSDAARPRYFNWAGSAPADGGNLVVGADDGQIVTGLAYLPQGVVIFKQRNTWLWSYSDSANPKFEGNIQILMNGVGCASNDSIAYYNGSIVWLGQQDDGDYGIYMTSGSNPVLLSKKIPKALDRAIIQNIGRTQATIFNDTYYIAFEESGELGVRTMVYAFDIVNRCWYEVSGWSVGAFGKSIDGNQMLIGNSTDGRIVSFPFGHIDNFDASDGSYTPIEFRFESKAITTKNALMEKRFRNIIADVKSLAKEDTFTMQYVVDEMYGSEYPRVVTQRGVWYWNEPDVFWGGYPNEGNEYDDNGNIVRKTSKYPDGLTYTGPFMWNKVFGDQRLNVPLANLRGKQLQIVMYGDVEEQFSIKRVGMIYRDRKVSSYR